MASIGHLQEKLAEKNDVDEVVLRAVPIKRLIDAEVDDGRFKKQRFKRIYLYLLQKRVLLMECHVTDVDGGRADLFKLLLQLEETILDLLFNIVRQLLLSADKFRILRVTSLLHDPRISALKRLLELINAAIGHGQLLVLLDLLCGLGCDTVNGRACTIHLGLHRGRRLVSGL